MRLMIVIAFLSLPLNLTASVQLDTSIGDVYHRGTNELAGSITWTVKGDDFLEAGFKDPLFIRVSLDHNARLAETLVHVAERLDPISLALRVQDPNQIVIMTAQPETLQIVRWVKGESSIWLSVSISTGVWLNRNGTYISPSPEFPVSWSIGVSARSSDRVNDLNSHSANLPFNTRESHVQEGDYEHAISTLLCVDLSESNLRGDGTDEALLNYDIICFDTLAEIEYGVYGDQGNPLGVTFSNDFTIARGKSRACDVTLIQSKDQVPEGWLCVYRAATNGTKDEFVKITRDVQMRLDCDVGGSTLSMIMAPGSYLTFRTAGRGDYGFDEFTNVRFTNVIGYSSVFQSFESQGRVLYRAANLYYNDLPRSLDNPYDLKLSVCVLQHYQAAPMDALLDWELTILGPDELDDPPYSGEDQRFRCEPSPFQVAGGVFSVGRFVPCQGNPVSLFFPYLPTLQGTDSFWVGLATVNHGKVDLELEAIGYDEFGMRFQTSLGQLNNYHQKTWLVMEHADGIVSFAGAGENNAGEFWLMEPDSIEQTAGDYGVTRSSLFIRGTFETPWLDEVFEGDLDGYLLIGNRINASVEGAYLPRNVTQAVPGQNADLPLWRRKAAP